MHSNVPIDCIRKYLFRTSLSNFFKEKSFIYQLETIEPTHRSQYSKKKTQLKTPLIIIIIMSSLIVIINDRIH